MTPMDIVPVRKLIGAIECGVCHRMAKVFADDVRAGNWLRFECDAGHWGDVDPVITSTKEFIALSADCSSGHTMTDVTTFQGAPWFRHFMCLRCGHVEVQWVP